MQFCCKKVIGVLFQSIFWFATFYGVGNNSLLDTREIEQAIQFILNDTKINKVNQPLKINADISYFGADMKYKDGNFKICEFVEARNATHLASDVFINNKIHRLTSPYWIFFVHYLDKFNLPVWFISNKKKSYLKLKFAYNESRKKKWRFLKSFEELKRDRLFIKQLHKKIKIKKGHVRSYRGIIIYIYRDDWYSERAEELSAFKKIFPQFLYINHVVTPFAKSKKVTTELFQDQELSRYRPQAKIYEKKYSEELVKRIKNDFSQPMLVIKPLNSGRSNGVIVINRENIDKELKKILPGIERYQFNYRPASSTMYEYWKHDKNTHFLIEEYCESKLLSIKNKRYDPTMRVFFIMRYDNSKIYTKILPGFWKAPLKSLDDEGSLSDRHKTQASSAPGAIRGVTISKKDVEGIRRALEEALPKIYLKMLLKQKNG